MTKSALAVNQTMRQCGVVPLVGDAHGDVSIAGRRWCRCSRGCWVKSDAKCFALLVVI